MFSLQALGSNGSGQLGLSHKDDVCTPEPVKLPSSFTHDQPICIAAGGNHTLLLLESGTLLSSGDASAGARGPLPQSSDKDLTPSFCPLDLSCLPPGSRVQHIAATWEASIIVATSPAPSSSNTTTSTNAPKTTVYVLGTGTKGELGIGPSTRHTSHPLAIPSFPPPGTHIIDISACMSHVVCVLSNGEAYGWGAGRKDQLGDPVPPPPPSGSSSSSSSSNGTVWTPHRIHICTPHTPFPIHRATCGREFTVLFGPPATGELVVLGSDKFSVRTQAPSHVAGWRDVGAGWGSVFVLMQDGTLVRWGRDDHGQLGLGLELELGTGRVRQMAVGSEHTVVLTGEGDVVAWGWGEHGNCGPISGKGEINGGKGQRNKLVPSSSLGEGGGEITMVGAGCATSWFVEKRPA